MRPSISRAILGGFVGTVLITVTMYYVAPVLLGYPMDIAQLLAPVAATWTGGMIVHFINGTVLFPLIYAAFLYRYLSGSPTLRGVYFGVALWLIAQVFVVPALGGGFFSAQSGGFVAVMGSLLGHLLYGAALGAIANGPQLVMVGREPLAHGR